MPRVKLIRNKEDVAAEHYALFDELAALRGRVSGPSTVVLHSPALARSWNEISEYLHRLSIVEPQDAELAVSAVAREYDCGYIYNAHVPQARKAGVSEATLAAVRDDRPLEGVSNEETAVAQYVRELIRGNRVTASVFAQLLDAHDVKWLVELTAWIGRYCALACVLNAFEVFPENPVEVLPDIKNALPRPRGDVRAPLPSPRVKPVRTREDLPLAEQPKWEEIARGRKTVGGPASILLYSPVLSECVSGVTNYLRNSSLLSPPELELAMIATAREKDCAFIWAAHASAARQEGVSDRAVAVVRDHGDLAGLPPVERDVADYIRQIHRQHRVTAELFDRLRDQHGVPWLVELTCLSGHYSLLASIVNAFEVSPEPGAEQLPL
jgi:4-carboxymuconolactone decarboxylase